MDQQSKDGRMSDAPKSNEVIHSVGMPDTAPKLCMDVMAGRWAAQTGRAQSDFEVELKNELHLPNLSHQETNKTFMKSMEDEEVKRHGFAAGTKLFNDAIGSWKCE